MLVSLVKELVAKSGKRTAQDLFNRSGIKATAYYRFIDPGKPAEIGAAKGTTWATINKIEAALPVPEGLFALVDDGLLDAVPRLDFAGNALIQAVVRSVIDPDDKLDWP